MENVKKDLAIGFQKMKDGYAVTFRVREVGTNGGKRKTSAERCGQTFSSPSSAIAATAMMMTELIKNLDADDLVGTLFEDVPDETEETTPAQDKRRAKKDKGNGRYPAGSTKSVFVPKGDAAGAAKGVFVKQVKDELAK